MLPSKFYTIKKKDRTECGNDRGLSLVAHAGKVLLKLLGNRLGDLCKEAGIVPKEQCDFRPQRSTTDVMFVVRRMQEQGRASNTSIVICFIDLAAYASVDRVRHNNPPSPLTLDDWLPDQSSPHILVVGCAQARSISTLIF